MATPSRNDRTSSRTWGWTLRIALCAATTAGPCIVRAESLGSMAGQVVDSHGGVVPGAKVLLQAVDGSRKSGAVVGASGTFEVPQLSPGEYLISAETAGLIAPPRLVRVRAGGRATADLTLAPAGLREQVVVTASGGPESAQTAAKAVTVVGKEDLESRDEWGMPEAIRGVAGAQTFNLGGPGQSTQVRLRGLKTDATAVLVDGLRFRDSASPQGDAGGFMSSLAYINSGAFEVLRGSGSSLYGTNAVGGAINMVTDEGAVGPPSGELQGELGGMGLVRARGTIRGSLARDRVRYSLGAMALDITDGVDGNDATRNTGVLGSVSWDLSPSSSLWLRGYSSGDRVELNTSPFTSGIPTANFGTDLTIPARALPQEQVDRLRAGEPVDYGDATYIPNVDDPDSMKEATFSDWAGAFNQKLGSRTTLRATVQRLRTRRTFTNGPLGMGGQPAGSLDLGRYSGHVDTADLRATFSPASAVQLVVGYEVEDEHYQSLQDNNRAQPQRVRAEVDISQRSHAAFAQVQGRFFEERLHVGVSGRAQAFRLRRPVFTFSGTASSYADLALENPDGAWTADLAVAYRATSGTKVRAHLGNAYRAPSLFERFGGGFATEFSTGGTRFTPYGDPFLKPDRFTAWDAGIDQALAGGRVSVSGTYFHTSIRQLIAFDFSGAIDSSTDPAGRAFGYLNTGGGRSRGLELEAKATPWRGSRLSTAYTFTDARNDEDRQVRGFFRALAVARHVFSFQAVQRIGDAEMSLDVLRTGSLPYPIFAGFTSKAYEFPAYTRVNLVASWSLPWRKKSVRLYAKGENLLGALYYEGGYRAPGRVLLAGAGFRY